MAEGRECVEENNTYAVCVVLYADVVVPTCIGAPVVKCASCARVSESGGGEREITPLLLTVYRAVPHRKVGRWTQQVQLVLPVSARHQARVCRVELAVLPGAKWWGHAVRTHPSDLDVPRLLRGVAIEQGHVPNGNVLREVNPHRPVKVGNPHPLD